MDYSNVQKFKRHGGAYDRGSADSWYGRPFDPHYFVANTYDSPRIELADMSVEEILAYTQGFKDNEAAQTFKDWGDGDVA